MHTLTKAFFDLLKHRIIINNKEVPLLINYLPGDHTPCITFNLASTSLVKRSYEDHILQGKDYPEQVKKKEYRAVFLD